MANTKKRNTTARKKTTTKKKSSTYKKKKTARNSSASTYKKNTRTTTKKATPKKTTTRKPSTKTTISKPQKVVKTEENKVKKVNTVTPIQEEPITKELPKLKAETVEISNNKNEANKVIQSEKFTGVKSAQKQIKGKQKSKANFVSMIKKNPLLKKLYKLRRKIRIYGITSVIQKKYIVGICFLLLFMVILPTSIYFLHKPNSSIDILTVEDDIDTLKTLSLNLDSIDDIINNTNAFTSLKNYDRYDFDNVFKLNGEYVDDFVLKYNDSKKQLLFIIKPTNNNYDNVVNTMNEFLKENKITNYMQFDYDGYIVYIKSKNEESDIKVKSKIMQTTKNVFTLLLNLKKDDIESTLKIPSNLYSEAVIKIARLKSDTCGYAIIKPTNVMAKNKIMTLMDEYYKSLEEKWVDNKTNLELVKNRYFEEYEGYLIYIISNNNKLVMELIKSK